MVELVLTVSILAAMGLAGMMAFHSSRVGRWPLGATVALLLCSVAAAAGAGFTSDIQAVTLV